MPVGAVTDLERRAARIRAQLTEGADVRSLIRLDDLLSHQRPLYDSPARFKIGCCGRQWGKSHTGLRMALFGHGSGDVHHPGALDGADILWLAPDYPQARAIWRMLMRAVRGVEGVSVHASTTTATFPGGGTIEVRSAENIDSVRGRKFAGAIIDEGAFLDLGYAFGSVVRPALAVLRGWCLIISTPKLGSAFNELCEATRDGRNVWSLFVGKTTDNTSIPADECGTLIASYPPGSLELRQEIFAELCQDKGELFDRALMQSYDRANDRGVVFGGMAHLFSEIRVYCDPAISLKEKADFSVVLVAGITARIGRVRHAAIIDVQRRKIEGPDQLRLITDAITRWRPSMVKIEAVSYQLSLIQHLRRQVRTRIEPVTPDKDKRARAVPAAAALARGEILLPLAAPWLADFVAELVRFPNPRVHDDQVDCLSMLAADLGSGALIHSPVSPFSIAACDPWTGRDLQLSAVPYFTQPEIYE